MIRLIGASLVIGSAMLVGNAVARSHEDRPRELAGIGHALAALETEISYARTPLKEALERSARASGGLAAEMFRAAAKLLASDELTPADAWGAAVREAYARSGLAPEDRDALLAFGVTLGACSAQDQLRHIALVRERLRANEAGAREHAERTGRMWRYLGATVGAMIVLLLY